MVYFSHTHYEPHIMDMVSTCTIIAGLRGAYSNDYHVAPWPSPGQAAFSIHGTDMSWAPVIVLLTGVSRHPHGGAMAIKTLHWRS